MTLNGAGNMSSAFKSILQEVEKAINLVSDVGAKAFAARDHKKAREALAQADELKAFRDKTVALREEWQELTRPETGGRIPIDAALRREWEDLTAAAKGEEAKKTRAEQPSRAHPRPRQARANAQRAGVGIAAERITPERTYRMLVLRSLEKRGGAARTSEVRADIEEELRGRFTQKDLRSRPGECPIWWNRAMWERLRMVKAGLLRSGSPRGVWEITAKGRAAVKGEA